MFIRALALFFCLGLYTNQAHANEKIYQVSTGKHEIKVMAYNLQNLFDAAHDEGKNDYEFLPKNDPNKKYCDRNESESNVATPKKGGFSEYCKDTDWTDTKVEVKFAQIKKSLTAQGDLPDVLSVSEVENPNIIGRLVKYLGYDGFVMTNSPDSRGIDTAILYKSEKLTLLGHNERELQNFKFKTRNLLVVRFKLNAQFKSQAVLAFYPVHWPSQRSPTMFRNDVAQQLRKFMSDDAKGFSRRDYHTIVLGDFNTTAKEKPNPVFDTLLAPGEFGLFDVLKLAEIRKHPYLNRMPPATYYYGAKNEWNEFDRIIISANLMDQSGIEVDPHSFRIHAPLAVTKTNDAGEKIPYRYNHRTESPRHAGYSDHFGVHVKVILQ